jgi:hypothetical protein
MEPKNAFIKIVEINKANGWKNPIFQPNNKEEFKHKYFNIKLDDFLEIESNHEVEIYRVSKRWGDLILYCKII